MSKSRKYGLGRWQGKAKLLLLSMLMTSLAYGQQIEVYLDQEKRATFDHFSEIPASAWIQSESKFSVPSDETDWVKIVITSSPDQFDTYLLRLGSGGKMTVFSSNDSFRTPLKSGPLFAADEVNYATGNSWNNKIRLELATTETTLFVRLDRVFQNKITIQPQLVPFINHMEYREDRNRFLWLFYGLMLFILVYQIFYYVLLNDITYLVHAAFVSSLVGFLAYHEGTTYQYIFSGFPWVNYHLNFLLGLIPLAYGLFFRSYLKLYRISKKLDRWFRRSAKLHAVSILLPILLFWSTGSTAGVYTIVHVVNLIFISLYVWIFSKALNVKNRQHQILIAGLTTFAFTGILITGSYLAGIELDWKIALECGTLIESMIFSFALAFRTKIWESERLESSQALVDQLRKNEELQNSFNQTLQEEVKTRTLQLKDALEKAEAGSRAKSEFLSSISHELRTPLNGIIGMTNLLKEDHSDTKEELFISLESSSQDLLRLVDNVLDYTALDAENIQLHPEEFILGDLLQQLSSAFEPVASAKGIGFRFPLVGKELLLTTDRSRLSQILNNILHNAFKFTSSGSVACLTEFQGKDQNDHDQIRFIISDTGIGMTEEEINLATTPFEQTLKGMQRGLQGVGIGLAIVKKLVELMNGELAITSTKGEGTTVIISLPIPVRSVKEKVFEDSPKNHTVSPLEGKSVLLVEDHLVNQKVASKYLTKWGMKVEVAENGLIAVNKVRETSYDLILMDLHMPVMDGLTAVKEIKGLGFPFTEIPIIALSAATHLAEVQKQVLDSGMLGFVTKPIKPSILKQRLEACFLSSPS